MYTPIRIVSALVLFGSAGMVLAQPDGRFERPDREREVRAERDGPRGGAHRGDHRPGPEARARLMERFDADGDGELSEAERQTVRETMKAEHESRRAEMKAKLLERFDDNGDGELDEAERAEIRAIVGPMVRERGDRRDGRGHDHRRHMHKEALERFDADEDGRLDEAERAVAKAFFEQKKAEIVARFDADGDGELNESEREAAKLHHREQRRLDVNRDGTVDAADLQAATDRLAAGERLPDLNGDGSVDAADLAELSQRIRDFQAE